LAHVWVHKSEPRLAAGFLGGHELPATGRPHQWRDGLAEGRLPPDRDGADGRAGETFLPPDEAGGE
jgi:hypothetical protein